MPWNSHLPNLFSAIALLVLPGCGGTSAPGEGVGIAEEDSLGYNSLGYNSLGYNSLDYSSLCYGALATESLASSSLVASGALTDPNALAVFKYIVGCALPPDASIAVDVSGTTYTFDGLFGLAPGWGTDGGTCDATCQADVSACIVARINAAGHVVPLSLRGDGLATSAGELAQYTNIDGVYYGDIFHAPMILDACLPPGVTAITRTCGTNDPCGVSVAGACTDLCDPAAADGSYPNCRDAGGTVYPGSLTVFLLPGQIVP